MITALQGGMPITDKFGFVDTEMEKRRIAHQVRRLKTISPKSGVELYVDGRPMINFCSNDYMALSKHPLLRQRAGEFMERYGNGSTASRLVCGTYDCFVSVEEKLAALKGTESSLIFNSGYQANVSVLPAITDRKSLILSDRLNHSSLIQGALLSRCDKVRFRHNDMDHLKTLLEKNKSRGYSRILIVTESVFSMDGDESDIDKLVELAEAYRAILVIDEAHATGVLGKKGMGLTCGKNVDVVIGTFGKACGSFGSYIACSKKLKEYLINCCTGFIYSTALPPGVIGCIDAALDILPNMDHERRELHSKADFIRSSLHKLGWGTENSTTQIIPVIVGEEEKTMALSEWLESNGIFAIPIRPPTVEKGKSRIRLSLSAGHTWEHVKKLAGAFEAWRG